MSYYYSNRSHLWEKWQEVLSSRTDLLPSWESERTPCDKLSINIFYGNLLLHVSTTSCCLSSWMWHNQPGTVSFASEGHSHSEINCSTWWYWGGEVVSKTQAVWLFIEGRLCLCSFFSREFSIVSFFCIFLLCYFYQRNPMSVEY